MAEHQAQQQLPTFKSLFPEKGPTTSQVLAIITLFPIGGILLTLSGLTLTGSVIGLAVTTPLFILFSPVLVPAAIVLALAVTGFLASGAFGLTAVSSLTWILNYVRGAGGQRGPESMEQVKWRMQEAAGLVGQRARDVGAGMQGKTQESGRT